MFCHLALWYWLRHHFEPPQSALILAGIDVVLAAIMALLAARSTPNKAELEALAVRHRAVEGVTASLAFSAIAMQLLRQAPNSSAAHAPDGTLPHPFPDSGLYIQPVLLQSAEIATRNDADDQPLVHHRHVAEPAVPHQP